MGKEKSNKAEPIDERGDQPANTTDDPADEMKTESAGPDEARDVETETASETAEKSAVAAGDESLPAEESGAVGEGSPETVEAAAAEIESERFLRLAAEFDNYKKRTAREFEEIVRRANFRLLRELVDILDNFERALESDAVRENGEAYRKGVELIYNQLADLLAKEDVTSIEAVGRPFDPHCHEAIMQVESEEFDEGIVCQEIQRGYTLGDRVLRHARVVVSRGGKTTDDKNGSSKESEENT